MVTLANVRGRDLVPDTSVIGEAVKGLAQEVDIQKQQQTVFSEFTSPAQKREAFLRISKLNPQFGKVVLNLLEKQEATKLRKMGEKVDEQGKFAFLLKQQSDHKKRVKLLLDKANEAVVNGEDPGELLRMAELPEDQLNFELDKMIIQATDFKTLSKPTGTVETIQGRQFIRQPSGELKEVSQQAPQTQASIETIEGRQFIRGPDGSLKAVPLPREQEVKPLSPTRFKQEQKLAALDVNNAITQSIAILTAKEQITGQSPKGQLQQKILEGQVADRQIILAKRQMRRDAAHAKALRLEGKIKEAEDLVNVWFDRTTGILGSVLKLIPGTDAKNLEATLTTIKAVLGFETLQAMRDASPTGGALGQTSDREIQLLTSTIASLDQSQSPEFLLKALNQIRIHIQNWKKIVNTPGALSGVASDEAVARPVQRFTITRIE